MLYFDFANPYFIYMFFVLLAVYTIYAIFHYQTWIAKNRRIIMIVASILLIWTQFARYVGVIYTQGGFDYISHLPFYMCRLSVLVLLYYTMTGDKRVQSFLFYWGALGLAGINYPNGPINNIPNLTETFYIDHFLLTMIPFFIVVYDGYKPSKKDLYLITGLMAVILYAFIPINNLIDADYFYLKDQSIFGVLFPGAPSILFATIHYIAAYGFFRLYYLWFKDKDYGIGELI